MNTFFDQHTNPNAEPAAYTAAMRTPLAKRPQPTQSAEKPISAPGRAAAPHDPSTEDEGELTVDIYDAGDAIVVQSTVAGVKPEDLDISITDDTVTVKGRRVAPEGVDQASYYYKELFWGNFSRSIILPEEVEDEESEATLKHGLLTVRLPKRRRGNTQSIKVKMT